MNKKLREIIKDDIYRYFGRESIPLKEIILQQELGLKFLIMYRKANYYYNSNKNNLLKYYYIIRLQKLSKKTNFQISHKTKIGRGCYIGHYGRIIVNPEAILGNNINLSTGVVIGQENRGKRRGTPILADNIWIGANAVIVGKINIGTNVLIAPNSYVNMDVPSNSIVVGNPARIISNRNACEKYVHNVINI